MLFGFSRGAGALHCQTCLSSFVRMLSYYLVVVRAVAGLFNYMQTLKPDLEEFDQVFSKGLRLYKGLKVKEDFQRRKHEV